LEIPTADTKRSGEFYKKLFGWEIDYSWGADYAIFNTGEGKLTGGGLDRKDKITPGKIIIYIQVHDINTMLEKAVKLSQKDRRENRNPKRRLVRPFHQSRRQYYRLVHAKGV